MKEYNVSFRKPKKRFTIKQIDRVIRVLDYIQNICIIRKYLIDKYDIDTPIINDDEMPLHRNETSRLKNMNIKVKTLMLKKTIRFQGRG